MRNSDPWFRFYVRTLNNPKVQRLPSSAFKGWINLLCLAKETDGELPPVKDISFRIRLSVSKTEELLNTLRSNGLIEGDRMHDWDEMQRPSDSSKERVRLHRKRHKEQLRNVTGNVTVTEQIRLDTDKKREENKSNNNPPPQWSVNKMRKAISAAQRRLIGTRDLTPAQFRRQVEICCGEIGIDFYPATFDEAMKG